MSSSRNHFYNTISQLRSLQSNPLFIDQGLVLSDHNSKARILRSGLAVSAFALLETFLEDRIGELCIPLSASPISYGDFTDELKSFFTVKAIQGFANRIKFMDKTDRLSFSEQHIPSLAQIFSTPASYTNFGFSPNGSNISFEDVRDLPGLFGASNGWPQMQTVCSEVGVSRMNLSNDFRNLQKARNLAAHDITSNIPSSDLDTHIETALLVGISCDISVSNAINWFRVSATFNQAKASITGSRPIYKFIQQKSNGSWSEYSVGNTRIIKVYSDFDSAKIGAKTRNTPGNYHIVVKDLSAKPIFVL